MAYANLTLIQLALTSSLLPNNDVQLKPVAQAYHEFYPICTGIGPVLALFCIEIENRASTMDAKVTKKNYETMKSMIDYELKNNLVNRDGSGTKLLRSMLREFEFFRILLLEIEPLGRSAPIGIGASKGFDQIYKPLYSDEVAAIASAVFKILPNKGDIIKQSCGPDYNKCQALIGPVVDALDAADERMESYYEEKGLINLV